METWLLLNWTNDNTNIPLAASGTGDIASFAVTAGTVSWTRYLLLMLTH